MLLHLHQTMQHRLAVASPSGEAFLLPWKPHDNSIEAGEISSLDPIAEMTVA